MSFLFTGESSIFDALSVRQIENLASMTNRPYQTNAYSRLVNAIHCFYMYSFAQSGTPDVCLTHRENPVQYWARYNVYTVNELIEFIRSRKIYKLRGFAKQTVILLKLLIFCQTGIKVDEHASFAVPRRVTLRPPGKVLSHAVQMGKIKKSVG